MSLLVVSVAEPLASTSPIVIQANAPPSADLGAFLPTQTPPLTIIEKIVAASREAGADENVMVAIAVCESRLAPNARNLTKKEDSRGIFQLNTLAHTKLDRERLYEVDYNIQSAFDLWKKEGYAPWTCFSKIKKS